jgi:hypothetical protein
MSECEFCLDEEDHDCESCKLPEFTDDYYRDTCDVCHEFMMMPYSTRDHFNLVVCKKCAKKQAKEVYDEFSNDRRSLCREYWEVVVKWRLSKTPEMNMRM